MSGFGEYAMFGAGSPGRRGQRGAVALEFALIAPLVLMILFGVLTWGLWLNDAMNLRQGVREASRQGVVNSFGSTTACGASYDVVPSPDIEKLVCQTKAAGAGITGDTVVKVELPDGWVRGGSLLVCTMIRSDRVPSVLPLPHDGLITSSSRMAIEVADPGQVETGGSEHAPSGADWSWCT
jgi:hypothetical protein